MSANSRKLTANEIQAVGAILQDKEAIELLKKINEQVVTEEDTKGKRKQNDIFAFVGFAHQEDITGADKESEEYQEKQGLIKKLVDTGLILEGFHVPLERKNEKKFGDLNLPATNEKVAKYRITEEGLTLLAVVGSGQQQQQQQQQQKPVQAAAPPPPPPPQSTKAVKSSSNNIVPDNSKQQQQKQVAQPTGTGTIKKEKAIANFKSEILDENKL